MDTQGFKIRYGSPEWPMKFRPGAKRTTGFGLDNTFGRLRIHNAIDIASTKPAYIWAPFFFSHSEYYNEAETKTMGLGVFGTIAILKVKDADFSMRIMHVATEDWDAEAMEYFIARGTIFPGEILATHEHIVGKSTGPHIHVEYVSEGKESALLNTLLYEQYNTIPFTEKYSAKYAKQWAGKQGLDEGEAEQDFYKQIDNKKIIRINDYLCQRYDYFTGYTEEKTFYNSYLLFNKL